MNSLVLSTCDTLHVDVHQQPGKVGHAHQPDESTGSSYLPQGDVMQCEVGLLSKV